LFGQFQLKSQAVDLYADHLAVYMLT